MSLTIGDLVAHLDLNDAGWRQGMTQAQRQLTAFEGRLNTAQRPIQQFGTRLNTTAQTATLSVNKLQSGMLVLAASATNANPAVARLATTVSAFALGGWVTVGVLAGLAAIGFAWKKLTEDAAAFKKAVDESVASLIKLGQQQALGGTFTQRQEIANGRARQEQLVEQMQPFLSAAARPEMSDFARQNLFEGTLKPLFDEWNKIEVGIRAKNEEIAAILEKSGDASKDAALETELFGIQLRELNYKAELAADGVRAMMAAAESAMMGRGIDFRTPKLQGTPEQFFDQASGQVRSRIFGAMALPNARLDLQPITKIKEAAGQFEVAVGNFGNGVKEMVQRTFSGEGLANLGANLASNAIGFFAGKVAGVVGDLIAGTDRLAQALEQNTRALRAGADFLAARLAGAGLGDKARQAQDALEATLNRIAVGDLAPAGGRGDPNRIVNTFEEEIARLGLTLADIQALADVLGIDLGQILTTDILQQFFDQIDNAVSGLDGLAGELERTTDAFRNLPEGFKIGARILAATGPATMGTVPGGGGTGQRPDRNGYFGTMNFAAGAIQIDAASMDPRELFEVIEREANRVAVRGRPTTLQRGMTRR